MRTTTSRLFMGFTGAAVALLAAATQSLAVPITIENAGFELPGLGPNPGAFDDLTGTTTNGWTYTGTGGGGSGVYKPVSPTQYAGWPFSGQYGAQMGYIGGSGTISQVLMTNLAADTFYVFSGIIGNRAEESAGFNPGTVTAQLYAGSSLLQSWSLTNPGNGVLAPFSVNYTSLSSVTSGQALKIQFTQTGPGQVNFDNIALDASSSTAVPDGGGTLVLLGMSVTAMGFIRHRLRRR